MTLFDAGEGIITAGDVQGVAKPLILTADTPSLKFILHKKSPI